MQEKTSDLESLSTLKISRRTALRLVGASLVAATAHAAGQRAPIARTRSGLVEGYWDLGVAAFKGIPYGGRVDGDRRWTPATRPEPWTGKLRANRFGPRAMQNDADNLAFLSPELAALLSQGSPPVEQWAPMSENCLTLNVWSAELGRSAKRPVMVWLHGGGYFSEVPPLWWNEGTNLAKSGDVVVVTVRHRLAAFGYLNLTDLGASDLPHAGNVGNLDLVHALQWVHENIGEFGGDPGNVTIFGESGGGAKVSTLLAMSSAKGLFHKAIIQSGAGLRVKERAQTAAGASAVIEAAGGSVDRLWEFRSLPAAAIVAAQSKVGAKWLGLTGPMLDPSDLPSHPFDPVATAISADVPIIVGTNRDEASVVFSAIPGVYDLTWDGLQKMAAGMFGERSDSLIETFKKSRPEATPSNVLFGISTNQMMRVPSIQLAERKSAQGKAPVFMYLLTYETEVLDGQLGAPHLLDIPFVFNNPNIAYVGKRAARFELARQMSGAWAAFAHTGHPDHSSIPHWQPYTKDVRATMIFDERPALVNDPDAAERLAFS